MDGAWNNPYDLKITEAIVFIIIDNQDDYNTFINLSDDAKKVFINDIVQDNYGDYIGCETVYGIVTYDSLMYADIITGYETASEDVTLETYEEGIPVTIVVQDKENNTYSKYEGNNNEVNAKKEYDQLTLLLLQKNYIEAIKKLIHQLH